MEVRAHITYKTKPVEEELLDFLDDVVQRLQGYGPVVSQDLAADTVTVTVSYDADRLAAAVPVEHLQAIASSFAAVGLGIPRLVAIEQVDANETITSAAA